MKSHTKIFLLTTLHMWLSKIQNMWKLLVLILYILLLLLSSAKWMDTLKKLKEINI